MELIKLHPPVVHFAIAFPVFLLLVDIYYIWKKKSPDGLHALLTYLSTLAVLAGVVSGILAYEPIEEKLYKIPVFEPHKYLGLFLGCILLGFSPP